MTKLSTEVKIFKQLLKELKISLNKGMTLMEAYNHMYREWTVYFIDDEYYYGTYYEYLRKVIKRIEGDE